MRLLDNGTAISILQACIIHGAALLGMVLSMPAWAHCAEPASSLFDGQWTLEFRVRTKPGGESFTTSQRMQVSPYNLHFHAASDSFQFQEDGALKLEIREHPTLAIRSTSQFGQLTLWDRQQHRGMLRVQGTGSGDQRERTLKLELSWTYVDGTGFVKDSFGGSSNYRTRASVESNTIRISNEAGAGTFPIQFWKSNWELKAESIEQTEVSPDVIVETGVYRARNESRLTPLDPRGFSPPLPVTQEIKLKQVRQLKLIPRG